MATIIKLIIEDDEGKTTVYPLTADPVSVGRREDNTVRLMERNVSRCHARLTQDDGAVFIEDLDSYNGVRINGERIQGRFEVREGDLVEIGDYHLALQLSDDEGRQASDVAAPPISFAADEVTSGVPLPPFPASAGPLPPPPSMVDDGEVTLLPGPSARSSVPRLICVSTDYAGKEFALTRSEIVIGRVEDNDIVIEHRSVSRNHAKVLFDGEVHKIVDLQSANGVLVNGEEYAMTDLREGDLLELGHVRFRFVPASQRFLPDELECEAMRNAGVDPPPIHDDVVEPVEMDFPDNAPTEVQQQVVSDQAAISAGLSARIVPADPPPGRGSEAPLSAPPAPALPQEASQPSAPARAAAPRAPSLPPESGSVPGFHRTSASPKLMLGVALLVGAAVLLIGLGLWRRSGDQFEREVSRLKSEQDYHGLVEYLDRQDPAQVPGLDGARARAVSLLEAQQRFEECTRRSYSSDCGLDFGRALEQADEHRQAKRVLQEALRRSEPGELQDKIRAQLKALSAR